MPASGRRGASRSGVRSSLKDTILAFHERLRELRFATGSARRVSPMGEISDADGEPSSPEAVRPYGGVGVGDDPDGCTPALFRCKICLKYTAQLVLYRDSPMCADCRHLLMYGRG